MRWGGGRGGRLWARRDGVELAGKRIPGPEDWFRYGERGLRGRRGKKGKKARLETRKGLAIFIASDNFIPGCETSTKANIGDDGVPVWSVVNQNPLVVARRPPAHADELKPHCPLPSPNPCQFRKPGLEAPTPGVEFNNFSTFGRRDVQGSDIFFFWAIQPRSSTRFPPTTTTALPLCDPSFRYDTRHRCAFRLGHYRVVADKRGRWAIGRTTRHDNPQSSIPRKDLHRSRSDQCEPCISGYHWILESW